MPNITLALPARLELRLLRLARQSRLSLSRYIVKIVEREVEILERKEPSEQPEGVDASARQLWKMKRAAQDREHKLVAEGELTNEASLFIPVSAIQGAKIDEPRRQRRPKPKRKRAR